MMPLDLRLFGNCVSYFGAVALFTIGGIQFRDEFIAEKF